MPPFAVKKKAGAFGFRPICLILPLPISRHRSSFQTVTHQSRPFPPTRFASQLAVSVIVAALLAACSTRPYQTPVLVAPAVFEGASAAAGQTTNRQWWTAFRDPGLNQLVALGLAQNLTVLQAVERIQEARANAGVAASSGLPQIGLSANAGMTGPSGGTSVTVQAASTNLSWMLDLYGRIASSKAASHAQLDAAYASAGVARIALAGEVAIAYVDLRYYQSRMALTRESKSSRRKTADLVQSAFTAGAATKLDMLRADQLIAIADAQLPALEVSYAQALNRLATLTGQSSSTLAGLLRRGGQPVPQFRASVGVPADVLRQRPDVIVAERGLAAAFAGVGLARADLYPTLTLGGTITASGLAGGSATTVQSFGPSLNLPLFTGGKVRGNISAAQSRVRQAQLGWQAAVRNAVEEIQDALAAYGRDGRNMAAQQRLMSISVQTLDLARSSFQIGEGDFLSVLEAERTLLDARAALADANRARAMNFIRLSVATADGVAVQ